MTPTASNVLFGWWSHDLGGFHNGTLGNRSDVGDEDPKSLVGSEMYLRWLQFGALSPMFRTHVSPPAPFSSLGGKASEKLCPVQSGRYDSTVGLLPSQQPGPVHRRDLLHGLRAQNLEVPTF